MATSDDIDEMAADNARAAVGGPPMDPAPAAREERSAAVARPTCENASE